METFSTITPVGRLVQGHPMVGQTTDMENRPLTFKDGSPRTNYFFAIAVPKTDPDWNRFWGEVYAVGVEGFPAGQYQQADFSWKVADGDAPQHANKEGFPGHWVIKCSSSYLPSIYTSDVPVQAIVDKSQLKRGDWVHVSVSVAPNGNQLKPGVYLNGNMVQRIAYGEEIQSGPDANAVFAAPVAIPVGASATPIATGAIPVTTPTTAPAPVGVPPVAPAPVAPALVAPAPVAPAPVAPAPVSSVPPVGVPPVAPTPVGVPPVAPTPVSSVPPISASHPAENVMTAVPDVVPPIASASQPPDFLAPVSNVGVIPVMTAAAGGQTYEALIAAGWTDEALRANAMIQ